LPQYGHTFLSSIVAFLIITYFILKNVFCPLLYCFDKIQERAQLKQSVSRLVNILFPELEKLVPSLHMTSVYKLLSEYPGASYIASVHITKLTNLLKEASKGRYGKKEAIVIRDAAKNSIGSVISAKSLELKYTIKLIQELSSQIDEVEAEIKSIMDSIDSPVLTIPGISYRMGAMIIAEIGDFSKFDSPDKILAYAGLSPSTYQFGTASVISFQNGKTRVTISSLRSFQRHKIRLSPGFQV